MEKVSWEPIAWPLQFSVKNTTHIHPHTQRERERDWGNYRYEYLPGAKYRKLNRIKAD